MPVDLDDVRNTHRRVKTSKWSNLKDRCLKCDRIWPCDAIQLADKIEQQTERAESYKKTANEYATRVAIADKEIERLREALDKIQVVDLTDRPLAANQIRKIARAANPIPASNPAS